GGLIAFPDAPGEGDFLLGRQQVDFANLPQVKLQRITAGTAMGSRFGRLSNRYNWLGHNGLVLLFWFIDLVEGLADPTNAAGQTNTSGPHCGRGRLPLLISVG